MQQLLKGLSMQEIHQTEKTPWGLFKGSFTVTSLTVHRVLLYQLYVVCYSPHGFTNSQFRILTYRTGRSSRALLDFPVQKDKPVVSKQSSAAYVWIFIFSRCHYFLLSNQHPQLRFSNSQGIFKMIQIPKESVWVLELTAPTMANPGSYQLSKRPV